MTKAEELAQRVIEQCVRRGVAEFVLCPGSRNSPLLAEALRSSLKCWGHIDERAAGFFALGRCRALGRPVAVITTSGTAAFEVFPAVIEALYQRLPLLAITADRPKRFRGTGAPQAIEQQGMFCVYAVWNSDTEDGKVDLDGWDGFGPAHINVCMDEPLLQDLKSGPSAPVSRVMDGTGADPDEFPSRRRRLPPPDIVLLGSLRATERDRVREFLGALGRPVVADATSGLREDGKLAPLLLRDGEFALAGLQPSVVLRIGGVPSLRFWRDLEERKEIRVYSVMANGFRGLARDSLMFDDVNQIEFEEGESVIELEASRERAGQLEALLRQYPRSEPGWLRTLSERIRPGASVFLGNSLPIREWNLAAQWEPRSWEYWANRGANGIDGNVSSWLGWSSQSPQESWGIFGDLTALYDLNGLWVQEQLAPAVRRLVVINNGGGGIFRRLPGLAPAEGDLARVLFSEHRVGFAPWADLWGCGYHLWDGGDLPCSERPGTVICEIRPDPEETESFWEAWNRAGNQKSSR